MIWPESDWKTERSEANAPVLGRLRVLRWTNLARQWAKKLKGKKSNPNNNSGGESFEQLVKDATQKHLKTPDSILNQKVIPLQACTSREGAVVKKLAKLGPSSSQYISCHMPACASSI